MISTLKTTEDLIYAYSEWEILNKYGQFDRDGEYIYIQTIWVKSRFNKYLGFDSLYALSKKIYDHPFSKNTKYVYWSISRDSDGRKIISENSTEISKERKVSPIYNKEKLLHKIGGIREKQYF